MSIFNFFKKDNSKISNIDSKSKSSCAPKDYNYELQMSDASHHFDVMRNSVDLILKTNCPKTFFSRYRKAVKEAEAVVKLCGNNELGVMAKETLLMLLTDRVELTNDFFDRCNDAGKLPFIKNEVIELRDEMPDECYDYFEDLLDDTLDFPCINEHIFCSVVFSNDGKPYYYLSYDNDIRCGDYVVVPVGKNNEEKTARVVKIEFFNDDNAPVPADKLKYIIDVE